MNEPKSSRYHRLRRRAGAASLACTTAVLVGFLWTRPSFPVWLYALVLALATELVASPLAYYRGVVLERRYELSTEPVSAWLRDQTKGFAISALLAAVGAELVYALMRWSPRYWWMPAAVGAAAFAVLLARLAPVLLLPLFYRFTPLARQSLADRLMALCDRAGVAVLGVFEWGLGAKTRRANAALAGSGRTRRILLSDTLLAEYGDDEIEVILAHELAHHVHGDIPKRLALEFVLLLLAFFAASVALDVLAAPLGLHGVADPAGLPLVLLVVGSVMLASAPLVNAVSRRDERRADRFALELTRRRDAFISAMRRLSTQNLSEENPSRLVVWLFHTHPPFEERIIAARDGGL